MLDTNVASHIIRGDMPTVLRRIKRVRPEFTVLSVITEAELRYGIVRRPLAHRLKENVELFLSYVEILTWNSSSAMAFARLRTELEGAGRTLHTIDMMIAAHAISAGCVLVTLDKALVRVPQLKVEDWNS